jgi:hypothetical protein
MKFDKLEMLVLVVSLKDMICCFSAHQSKPEGELIPFVCGFYSRHIFVVGTG